MSENGDAMCLLLFMMVSLRVSPTQRSDVSLE